MNTHLLTSNADNLIKLTENVLIEPGKDGSFSAQVWGMPEYKSVGATREEALANLSQQLKARLEAAEIVSLDIELAKPAQVSKTENPWMKLAGKYKDDPDFQNMLDYIESYRNELDVEMEEYYQKLDAEETK
jgi:predicted RNase H-like HicB family nuclease